MEKQQGRYPPVPTVRYPLDLRSLGLSKNYEDSIRRRNQMEVAAQQREQEGKRLMHESDSIRKKLK